MRLPPLPSDPGEPARPPAAGPLRLVTMLISSSHPGMNLHLYVRATSAKVRGNVSLSPALARHGIRFFLLPSPRYAS